MSGLIYHTFCIVNGKPYVGQTWLSLDARREQHEGTGGGGARLLTKAIRKHGKDKFIWTILVSDIKNQNELDAAETAFIRELSCLAPAGYNLKEGGLGGRFSIETKKLLSNKRVGVPNPRKGLRMSETGRQNIAAAAACRKSRGPVSNETREKMRASNTGKKHKGGWKLSAETKERQRLAALRRWHAQEIG